MSSPSEQQMQAQSEFFIPASYNKPVIRPTNAPAKIEPKMASLFTAKHEMGHLKISSNISSPAKTVGHGIDPSHYKNFTGQNEMPTATEAKPKPKAPPKNWNQDSVEEKEKKRNKFRPKENSKLDKFISCLEDKRIKDDDLEQLEDLQMPRLRKVLNIIFLTLGIFFLLSVMSIIMYTSFSKEASLFAEMCHHKSASDFTKSNMSSEPEFLPSMQPVPSGEVKSSIVREPNVNKDKNSLRYLDPR